MISNVNVHSHIFYSKLSRRRTGRGSRGSEGGRLQLIGVWGGSSCGQLPDTNHFQLIKIAHRVQRLPVLQRTMATPTGYRLLSPPSSSSSPADPTVCIHFNDSRISIVFLPPRVLTDGRQLWAAFVPGAWQRRCRCCCCRQRQRVRTSYGVVNFYGISCSKSLYKRKSPFSLPPPAPQGKLFE